LSPLRGALSVVALVLVSWAGSTSGQAGVAPSTTWAAPCADRLRLAVGELHAAGVQLPGLDVGVGSGPFGPGAMVTLESDDGRLHVVIETWSMGIPADLPWEDAGYGECADDAEMAEPWVLRLVRNYAVDRQAQIQLRGVPRRHGRVVRRILGAALDACAAMP
jgi:hypothetical protein